MTNSVRQRLWDLSSGNPHGVRLLAQRECCHWLARQVERRLHAAFADRAIGREWFDVTLEEVEPVLDQLCAWAAEARQHMPF